MAEYVPDNLDAYYAHQAELDRRAEMAEMTLPICPVCEQVIYPGDGVYIPEAWETVHKCCLRDFILDGQCIDEEEVYVQYAISKLGGREE